MSNDPGLVGAFKQGLDIHTATAAKVFNVALDEVNRIQRSQAKAVNFGILYGQGALVCRRIEGSRELKQKKLSIATMSNLVRSEQFTKECVKKAREHEYAETILGRRRKLPDINSNNGMVKAFAERNAVNAPFKVLLPISSK